MLGQLPAFFDIDSRSPPAAEPLPAIVSEPAAEPEPAIVSEPLPAIVSEPAPEPEPAIVSEPEPDPAIVEPDAVPAAPSSAFFFLQAATLESARDRASNVIAVRIEFPPRQMLQRLRVRFLLAALVFLSPLLAYADVDVRLPPGTRADASGQLVSSRGLRETTDVIAKDLARRGVAHQQIGPYRVRGVELTRFLSQTPSTAWLAIHVLRAGSKTLIFVVPRTSP